MKYAISSNGEDYDGDQYDTVVESIAAAIYSGYEHFWVGEVKPPLQPEEWCGDYFLDLLTQLDEDCDDYYGDWASDWRRDTKEQRAELAEAVKSLVAAWLDRHDLRPRFFIVATAWEYVVESGSVRRVGRAMVDE